MALQFAEIMSGIVGSLTGLSAALIVTKVKFDHVKETYTALNGKVDCLDKKLSAVKESQARIEGFIKGLLEGGIDVSQKLVSEVVDEGKGTKS